MVRAGRWRATRDVKSHAGFRLNALVSLLSNASWGQLAAEYERAKGNSDMLEGVHQHDPGAAVAGRGRRSRRAGARRAGRAVLPRRVPAEVLAVTVGVDVQGDRLEASVVGWGRDGTAFVLTHQTLWGLVDDEEVWRSLDELLRQKWKHPHGGMLKVDAAAIDAGSGSHYDTVLSFCQPRLGHKVFAVKGTPGFARTMIQRAKLKRGKPLFLAGVDVIKAGLFAKLDRGKGVRFSNTLGGDYFEQLASERRVVRMVRGRPTARFERIPGKRAESLDALVYATAAKAGLALSQAAFSQKEDELRLPAPKKPIPAVIRSSWMDRMGGEPW